MMRSYLSVIILPVMFVCRWTASTRDMAADLGYIESDGRLSDESDDDSLSDESDDGSSCDESDDSLRRIGRRR